jgi:hypothetical protein
MKELIEEQTGLSVWVQGVIAVWSSLAESVVERDNLLYVRGQRLVETLRERRRRLGEVQRGQVIAALDVIAGKARESSRRADRHRFASRAVRDRTRTS